MIRILIVEDDGPTAQIIQAVLRGPDRTFEIVPDGLQALRLLSEGRYDAITTDIYHLGLNGLEMITRIRKGKYKNTPIMVISGHASAHADEAYKRGANDVIDKPFEPELLPQRFDRLLRQ